MPFEYVFEDVLTAKTDGVVVNAYSMIAEALGLSSGRPERTAIGHLQKGEQISGHATFAYEFDPPSKWEDTSIDSANLIVLSPAGGEFLGRKVKPYERLLIRADLVEHSYRAIDDPTVREKFPHLF